MANAICQPLLNPPLPVPLHIKKIPPDNYASAPDLSQNSLRKTSIEV